MKLGIMQPYFFPYIGYWQLINASDEFILFDDIQYIKHGWINRNRILKLKEGWTYILVPLKKHSRNDLIRDITISENSDWENVLLRQLEVYKKIAPFYNEVIQLIENTFSKITDRGIVHVNETILRSLSEYLEIKTKITVASQQDFDYHNVNDAGEWALRISEQKNASEYINPVSGKELFDRRKFDLSDIKLSFLNSNDIMYKQNGRTFEPNLSIIDVLMFNGQEQTIKLLNKFNIQEV